MNVLNACVISMLIRKINKKCTYRGVWKEIPIQYIITYMADASSCQSLSLSCNLCAWKPFNRMSGFGKGIRRI